jgi:acyl-CoA synthetase (AMP-forming)/AMP-acid ligase II
LNGRNLFPQDVELTAERAHPLLSPGSAVAFATDDGRREALVVLVEVEALRARGPRAGDTTAERPLAEVLSTVNKAVTRDHQVEASIVGIVPRGELLKTSSGKIRRQACRAAYLNGKFTLLDTIGAPL